MMLVEQEANTPYRVGHPRECISSYLAESGRPAAWGVEGLHALAGVLLRGGRRGLPGVAVLPRVREEHSRERT